MRRLALLSVLVLVALLTIPPSAGAVQKRIFNGDDAGHGEYPWTVALVQPGRPAETGQFCDGVLVSETRVLTAAHCTISDRPEAIEVVANVTDRRLATDADRYAVQDISVHPKTTVDDEKGAELLYDVSILTLAEPVSPAHPIPLMPQGTTFSPAALLKVTGWGLTEVDTFGSTPPVLQEAEVHPLTDADCRGVYGSAAFGGGNILCALRVDDRGTPLDADDDLVIDTCQGDSGGPITTIPAVTPDPKDETDGWLLAGLVSHGSPDCEDAGWPGAYASLRNADMHDYVNRVVNPNPASQPLWTGGRPEGTIQPVVGETFTCAINDMTFSAGAVPHALIRRREPNDTFTTVAREVGKTARYTLTAADAGKRFRCEVRGIDPDAGGYAKAYSGGSYKAILPAAPATPAPAPAAPPPPPPVVEPPAPFVPAPVPRDASAPQVSGFTRSCSTRRRCTLRLRIDDALPSAGLATPKVTLTTAYRTTCRRDGRARRCTKRARRTLRARRSGTTTTYVVSTGVLRKGRHTVSVSVTDLAGNRRRTPFTASFSLR